MTDNEISNAAEDELVEIKLKIQREIERRKKEEKKRCYAVSLNGSPETFCKKYADAKAKFLEEVDFSVKETGNEYSIKAVDISASEYRIRPDTWYCCHG